MGKSRVEHNAKGNDLRVTQITRGTMERKGSIGCSGGKKQIAAGNYVLQHLKCVTRVKGENDKADILQRSKLKVDLSRHCKLVKGRLENQTGL